MLKNSIHFENVRKIHPSSTVPDQILLCVVDLYNVFIGVDPKSSSSRAGRRWWDNVKEELEVYCEMFEANRNHTTCSFIDLCNVTHFVKLIETNPKINTVLRQHLLDWSDSYKQRVSSTMDEIRDISVPCDVKITTNVTNGVTTSQKTYIISSDAKTFEEFINNGSVIACFAECNTNDCFCVSQVGRRHIIVVSVDGI